MESRYKMGKVMAEEYKRAKKKDKGYLLDLVVNSSGYSWCYAGWLLRNIGRRVVLYEKGERIILEKNDSCYVEQKNYSVARKCVGYSDRFINEII